MQHTDHAVEICATRCLAVLRALTPDELGYYPNSLAFEVGRPTDLVLRAISLLKQQGFIAPPPSTPGTRRVNRLRAVKSSLA